MNTRFSISISRLAAGAAALAAGLLAFAPASWAQGVATLSGVAGNSCSYDPGHHAAQRQHHGGLIGVASVYMTVRNDGGKDELVAAHAAVPNALVELHDVQNNRMAKVERIAVPARGELKLRPGSWHLMVFNLPRAMKEGDDLSLTLRFERSGE